MAAAALRSVANKICGRPPLQLHAYFTAAVKEEQRGLLPSALRRFSSSESLNLVNKMQLPRGCATNNAAEPTASLAPRIDEKKRELLHLLRQTQTGHPRAAKCALEENKELLDLLRRTPPSSSRFVLTDDDLFTITVPITVATGLVTVAVFYVENKYIFGIPVFGVREATHLGEPK